MERVDCLDHGFVRLVDHMGSDLSVVRATRVSYDAAWRAGENEGSDDKLLRFLWRNHHTTPFEAVTLTFEVMAPIFAAQVAAYIIVPVGLYATVAPPVINQRIVWGLTIFVALLTVANLWVKAVGLG